LGEDEKLTLLVGQERVVGIQEDDEQVTIVDMWEMKLWEELDLRSVPSGGATLNQLAAGGSLSGSQIWWRGLRLSSKKTRLMGGGGYDNPLSILLREDLLSQVLDLRPVLDLCFGMRQVRGFF
jgi:hypothetical protein